MFMRFCVIGDIHGRDYWLKFIKENENSHIVFLGDYCDPHGLSEISDDQALENLKLIVDYKELHPDNVTLLIGNHDVPYIYYPSFGIRDDVKLKDTVDFFQKNKNLFQFAYQKENHLFVHAGVSTWWCEQFTGLLYDFGLLADKSNLADVLNNMADDDLGRKMLMMVSSFRGGEHEISGPLWSDKRELETPLYGMHQYVGHNIVDNIWTKGDKKSSITFCDVLSRRKKCLIINIVESTLVCDMCGSTKLEDCGSDEFACVDCGHFPITT